MLRYRIVAYVWLVLGTVGFALSVTESIQLLRLGQTLSDGSDILAALFCGVAAISAIGMLRRRRWASYLTSFVAAVFFLYCLSFIVMVGVLFGPFFFSGACAGLALAAYTFYVLRIVRLRERSKV